MSIAREEASPPLTVLLVEDNPGDARLIRERLADLDRFRPRLDHVETLAAAVERLRGSAPDLVLLDLNLPDSRDIGTVRTIVEAAPGVPVIVLTGRKTGEAATRALRLGAQDYLVKDDITGPLLERSIRYAVERKAAGEEVRWHERRFRALAESAPDAIVTVDTVSRIVYANPAVEEIFGHDPDELVGSSLARLMPEELEERHHAGMDRYLATGERSMDWSGVEFPARRADGSLFPAELSFAEYTIGGERYFTGIIRDVSEREQTRRELRESERRFRLLAEHIEEVFYLWDVRPEPPQILYLSPGHEKLTGLPADELLEDPNAFAEMVHPDDRNRAVGELDERLRGETASRYRIVRQDGAVRWIHDETYPVRDEDGEIRYAAGIARDVTEQVELQQEVERERARFQEVFEDAPALIATLRGPDHVFEMANPAYRDAVGDRELVGKPVREVFPDPDEADWIEALDRAYRTGEPIRRFESPIQLGTSNAEGGGEATRFATFSHIPRRRDGEVVGVLMLGTDVTEQVEARRDARRSEELFTRTLETMAEGIMLADGEGNVRFVNPAAASMLGREPEEIEGTAYNAGSWRITAPDGGPFPDRDLPVARVLRSGEAVHEVEHAVERPDGSRIVLSVNAAPVEGVDGGRGVVASIRDVTEQKEFEAQLEHRALHDYLTGLPNRALLRDRLDHSLQRARRTGERLAVLFLDLDRFKTVNDSLGHEAGDRVLEEVSRRLEEAVRDRDTVARVGGDEFIVLLEDVSDEEAARETAERLAEVIATPIHLAQDRVRLDASVGVALHEPKEASSEEERTSWEVRGTHLIRRADRAMFRVKELAGQRIAVAGAEDDEDLRLELSREMRLREALEEERLSTVYQPVFDLESGKPVGAEALARWADPELGEVRPGEFIPLAEETGLIVPLGEQQLDRACRAAGDWPGLTDGGRLRVHVNLSARQLSDPALLDRVREVLERTGFPAERLHFEVTESAAMREARRVDQLKELGAGLSVDDFGTRYSTLAQVKRLNVDSLKIDRSFVRNLVDDRRDRAIVEATLALGRAMELRVVAEGIETREQLAVLREMGCQEGQGFGLAQPMDGEAFARWLSGNPKL